MAPRFQGLRRGWETTVISISPFTFGRSGFEPKAAALQLAEAGVTPHPYVAVEVPLVS